MLFKKLTLIVYVQNQIFNFNSIEFVGKNPLFPVIVVLQSSATPVIPERKIVFKLPAGWRLNAPVFCQMLEKRFHYRYQLWLKVQLRSLLTAVFVICTKRNE